MLNKLAKYAIIPPERKQFKERKKKWFSLDLLCFFVVFFSFSSAFWLLVFFRHSFDALWLFVHCSLVSFSHFYVVSMNLVYRPSLWLRALTHPCLWTRSITHSKSFEHQSLCSTVFVKTSLDIEFHKSLLLLLVHSQFSLPFCCPRRICFFRLPIDLCIVCKCC